MRKALFSLAWVLSCWCASAQVPAKISYQAVLRNSNNELIVNQTVGIRISVVNTIFQASYIERHTAATNANGLITLQIGGGTVISGSLEGIDWDRGPYRLKTDTDPTGGFTYTITGFTDILAVPYAFEANHALVADSLAPGRLKIGDRYQGGIIFWLDKTGEHGLIVDSITHGAKWNNGVNRFVGSTADGIYGGRRNTDLILAIQIQDAKGGLFAARYCMTNGYLARDGYEDWYLPSTYELKLLYKQKGLIPALTTIKPYWSSTERPDWENWSTAETLDFTSGSVGLGEKGTELLYRCIRSF